MKPVHVRYDPTAPGRTMPRRCVSPAIVEHALEKLFDVAGLVDELHLNSVRVPDDVRAELRTAVRLARDVVKRCKVLR